MSAETEKSALHHRLGDELHDAFLKRQTIAPLSERGLNLSIDDAYHIQTRMISRRLAAGSTIVGKKIGVTSDVVQKMMNVLQPDFGWLLSDMQYQSGDAIKLDQLIQPRFEGEIAFILKKDIKGPGLTAADILAATEGVMACIEIVDSRIENWRIKIEDTISDNASCGAFVLGDRLVDPREVDLRNCGMVIEKNGELVATGAGAASMNSPVNAVCWLANTLGRLDIPLNAGDVILSGSLVPLIPVALGDVFNCRVGGIGSCSVSFI